MHSSSKAYSNVNTNVFANWRISQNSVCFNSPGTISQTQQAKKVLQFVPKSISAHRLGLHPGAPHTA